jgi:hypothetical protein
VTDRQTIRELFREQWRARNDKNWAAGWCTNAAATLVAQMAERPRRGMFRVRVPASALILSSGVRRLPVAAVAENDTRVGD